MTEATISPEGLLTAAGTRLERTLLALPPLDPTTSRDGIAELLHRRVQVQPFLRLMGLEPQDVYDPTPA